MTDADRRFYGSLLLIFEPLFITGGWLASFTDVGALLILAGTVMLVAAPVLLRSLRIGAISLTLAALGWGLPLVASL